MKYLPLFVTTTLIAAPLADAGMQVKQDYSRLEKDLPIKLTFEQAAVAQDQVGKPAAAGVVSITPAIDFKTVWLSPTELELRLLSDAKPRVDYELAVNLDGGLHQAVIRSRVAMDISHEWYPDAFYPIFFKTYELGLWEDSFKKSIAGAFYKSSQKGQDRRYPAKVRQATVADVLTHKDVAEERYDSLSEEEWADFAKLPPAQLVPNLWMVEPFDFKAAGSDSSMELYLPDLGEYDVKLNDYKPLYVGRVDVPSRDFSIENKHIGEGLYRVTVAFDSPVIASASLADMLPSIKWVQNFPDDDSTAPLAPSGKLGYKSSPISAEEQQRHNAEDDPFDEDQDEDVKQPMEVVLDIEATDKHRKQVTLASGEKKDLLTAMVFTVKKGLAPSSLTVIPELETLTGPIEQPKKIRLATTALRPESPSLQSDVEMNALSLTGNRAFTIDYKRLNKPRVRVLEFDNRGATPARVIAAYENYYSGYGSSDDKYDKRASKSHAARLLAYGQIEDDHVSLVPTELLGPLSERSLALPEGNAELTLSLNDAALYPNTGSGLYIIEITGEALPDINGYKNSSDEPAPLVASQGLVQVTDLGLLWKSSYGKRKVFVYGYHLSTGGTLAQARISFYTAEAKLLHEQALSPEGSSVDLAKLLGDKASQVAYLHVSTPDDAYTVAFNPEEEDEYTGNGKIEQVEDMENYPYLLHSLFTDRPLYRPGETVHVKGFLRLLQGNKLSIPSRDYLQALRPELYHRGDTVKLPEVSVQQDGSFSFSFTLPAGEDKLGNYDLTLKTVNPSDKTYSSPDMKALGITDKQSYREKTAKHNYHSYEYHSLLDENRSIFHYIRVQHFRRNEFELSQKMTVSPDANAVAMEVDAQQFTGAPVAGGKAIWRLVATDTNLYPAGLDDYRFGDYRTEDMGYFNTYFWYQENEAQGDNHSATSRSILDDKGKGSVSLTRPQGSFPRRQKVIGSVEVTNGNEQSLSATSSMMVDPADIYIGIRQPQQYSKAGPEGLKLDLLTVDPKGVAAATPGPINIEVSSETSNPYQYGSLMHQMLRFSSENETYPMQTVMLDAQGVGSVQIPTPKPGVYTITASGKDMRGREFRSAIKHVVWGQLEDGSVWQNRGEKSLTLIADQDSYKPGETVRLLLQTPFDGEVLLSLQREGILRQYRKKVTKDKPVIEFELQAGDAPEIDVEVILISGGAEHKDGKPRILANTTTIKIDPAEQRLAVKLDLPEKSVLPGETCELSGQVLNAQGSPAAHANIVLYAEDEGTLQAGGFSMPNPLSAFYGHRPKGVNSYSSLGQLLTENVKWRTYGNKGIFIGGGDDEEGYFGADNAGGVSSNIKLRENFAPCALWLGHVVTDAEGRFKAQVKNPDTLTRYRVIAVAAAGAAKFGTGTGHYQVNKPIMLEPSAPLSATKGDLVQVPVTVTMIPDDLPPEVRAQPSVTWKVQLKGSDTVEVLDPVQTITLNSSAPRTIPFAVNMKQTGPVRFEWRVEPVDAMGGKMSKFTDGVADQFVIRPATPYLRESLFVVMNPGTQARAYQWLKTDFDPEQTRLNLTLSPSPIAAFTKSVAMLHDYPYGCTEQLSSRCVPYIYAEPFHRAAGTPLAPQAERQKVLSKFVTEIMARRLGSSALFSYWPGSAEPTEFSAYAYLVLTRAAMQKQLSAAAVHSLNAALPSVLRELIIETDAKDKEDNVRRNPLWLYALASQKKLTASTFHRIVANRRHDWTDPQELWLIALVAQMVSPETASIYVMNAENAPITDASSSYYLPPVDIVKQLISIVAMPEAEMTAEHVEARVRKHASSLYNSTLSNAWMGLMLADYIERAKLADAKASVNGKQITPSTPLSYAKAALISLPEFKIGADGGKVYATGTAEGYLKKEQPEQLVDRGFHVQRRYEKLQLDGTWVPTAEFRVGDIVRITVTAKSSQDSRYVALEDYLPAGMEAVNPDVPGQLLPPTIMADKERSWYSSSWITRQEYLKDRVRFFMNHWSANAQMEASYIARVTKAGVMKAPAAKAEEMYKPEVYGLALPLKVTIQP